MIFPSYKSTTISRRVERRMQIHRIKNAEQHYARLRAWENPHEADVLFKELLIGVTSFFRDPEAFTSLARKALPELLAAKPEGSVLRVWVAGCSTGEGGVYTIAMALQNSVERPEETNHHPGFCDGTWTARPLPSPGRAFVSGGNRGGHAAGGTGASFFVKEGKQYRLKKSIRELVVFAPQNASSRTRPSTKLDMISCRNLLIYLNADVHEAAARAVSLRAENRKGCFFWGHRKASAILATSFCGGIATKKWRIFSRKKTAIAVFPPVEFPSRLVDAAEGAVALPVVADAAVEPRAAALFEKLLADRFVPASVIVNVQGDISYIHERQTGAVCLEPAPGQPRLNVAGDGAGGPAIGTGRGAASGGDAGRSGGSSRGAGKNAGRYRPREFKRDAIERAGIGARVVFGDLPAGGESRGRGEERPDVQEAGGAAGGNGAGVAIHEGIVAQHSGRVAVIE